MYGLPACYWLIDEGEEKDSVLQQKKKKNGARKANNEEIRVHKSSFLCFCVLGLLSFVRVNTVGKDLMTLSGEPSQHDLVTFALYVPRQLRLRAPWRANVTVRPPISHCKRGQVTAIIGQKNIMSPSGN